jgi:hypothetical protein
MFSGAQGSGVLVAVLATELGSAVAVMTIYSATGVGATFPHAARMRSRIRLNVTGRRVVFMMDPLPLVSSRSKLFERLCRSESVVYSMMRLSVMN